jgi:hypothetical protein
MGDGEAAPLGKRLRRRFMSPTLNTRKSVTLVGNVYKCPD